MLALLPPLTGPACPDGVYVSGRLQVFELMRRQEDTRLAEIEAEKVRYAINEKLRDIVSS